MVNRVKNFLRREEGASLVEYTLLLVLIAVVAITAVSTLGTTVSTQMNNVEDKIDSWSIEWCWASLTEGSRVQLLLDLRML
jgi:pilus assembly protein Flp/PilA